MHHQPNHRLMLVLGLAMLLIACNNAAEKKKNPLPTPAQKQAKTSLLPH